MQKPALRTLVEGGAVIAIGVSILLLLPSQINPIAALQTRMSPGLIPLMVAIGLILAGTALIVQPLLSKSDVDAIDLDRSSSIRVVATVLLLVAYTMIFPRLGFVVTSGLFIGFFTWFFGARDPVKITLLVVLTPLIVWLFFEKLFQIPLPSGLLI